MLYPFGHGLSFTRFEYRGLVPNASSVHPCDAIGLRVAVANTGKIDGDEVCRSPLSSLPPRFYTDL